MYGQIGAPRGGRRLTWLVIFGVVLVTGLGLAGCNKKTAAHRGNQSFLSPDWNSSTVTTLAFCGVRTSTGGETDRAEAEQIVEAELRGSQDRFVILTMKNADTRAEAAGQTELLDRVRRVWRDDQLVDQFLAKDLCKALGVEGLLLGDLGDWTEQRIDISQEGTSWTRVELGLYIYSADSGLLVWGADRSLRKDSIPYRPSAVVGEGAVANERAERRSERASSVTPDPPEIETVAHELMGEILAVFPPKE
ncbi:MAG: hypothetical protein KC729_18250 [Candidatus Eisenbacteria bacterium]|uniref:Uncharacterized protein n=1 Tax=Eiseniibacteriota bacterium TaxID=2212470 RepID=A0A956M1T2_UNCEI|nr:hypothetical protein [Candidatus Eisenbacteria bacterium]